MISKNLILALSAFASGYKEVLSDNKDGLLDDIQKSIQEAVLTLAFKLFIGLVLTSVIIFSLFKLGEAAEILLSQLENGLAFEIIFFTSIFIFSSIGLYLMLYGQSIKSVPTNIKDEASPIQADLQKLAMNFADGFISGLESADANKKANSSHENIGDIESPNESDRDPLVSYRTL